MRTDRWPARWRRSVDCPLSPRRPSRVVNGWRVMHDLKLYAPGWVRGAREQAAAVLQDLPSTA